MKRTDLLRKLEMVAPALANNDIIPELTHLCFTGEDVVAYNGHVGISLPCKTEFAGCVPGVMTISFLNALSAKEVEFEEDDKVLRVKGGSTKSKFASLSTDAFLAQFTMPKAPKASLACDADRLLRSIALCMRSVTTDTSVPDQLGITVMPSKSHVAFFGSNTSTLSRGELPVKGDLPFPERAILPALFCKQLLVLAKEDEKLFLTINDRSAMYAGPDGLRMWGNLVDSPKPLNYPNKFRTLHPVVNEDKLYPIAEKLANVLTRANIIASSDQKAVRTRVTIEKGHAQFVTRSALHEVKDTMDLPKEQGDVVFDFNPKDVLSGVEDFKRMLITQTALVMENKYGHYFVAGKGD